MIMKRFLLLCLLFVPCLAAQAETYRVEAVSYTHLTLPTKA